MGQIIASGVLRSVLSMEGQWAYRLPFALQCEYSDPRKWSPLTTISITGIWPVPILVGCLFAPESPWWQVRKGRHDDARRTIRRLFSSPSDEEVENSLSLMKHTNAIEKTMAEGTSYWDCFRGVDLRRTEIAAAAWMIQNLCGAGESSLPCCGFLGPAANVYYPRVAFMGYSTFFLEQAGLPVTQAFNLSIAQYALGICGTIVSWVGIIFSDTD